MRGRRTRWLGAMLIALTACGGSPGVPDEATVVDTAAATVEPASSTPEAGTWDYPDDVGFVEVTLLTPQEGVGLHPELTWEPLEGTDLYMVVVTAPSGEPYWSWMGPETSIHLGGEPQLADGADGPALVAGMAWSVIAIDAAGAVIGVSVERPISP